MQARVLVVTHSFGGGTEQYLQDLLNDEAIEQEVFILKYKKRSFVLLKKTGERHAVIQIKKNYSEALQQLVADYHINRLIINHLAGYPIPDIIDGIIESGLPYTVMLHDFFSACPGIHLLNDDGQYCQAETDIKTCQACLNKQRLLYRQVAIDAWRSRFRIFLQQASEVIVPSESTKTILSSYYETESWHVIPHKISVQQQTYDFSFTSKSPLTIAFPGTIQHHKGEQLIYDAYRWCQKKKLPVRFVIIGSTSRQKSYFVSRDGHWIVTGPYNHQDLPNLLAKYEAALVGVLSICPETFSYTLHEAMASGYPVLSTPMGAQGEAVLRYGGWLLSSMTGHACFNLLAALVSKRELIIKEAEKLQD